MKYLSSVEYNDRIEYPRKNKTSLIYHLTITREDRKFTENILNQLVSDKKTKKT